jgi:hypothetical protein
MSKRILKKINELYLNKLKTALENYNEQLEVLDDLTHILNNSYTHSDVKEKANKAFFLASKSRAEIANTLEELRELRKEEEEKEKLKIKDRLWLFHMNIIILLLLMEVWDVCILVVLHF